MFGRLDLYLLGQWGNDYNGLLSDDGFGNLIPKNRDVFFFLVLSEMNISRGE